MELENFEGALEALIASGAANYGDGESMEKLHSLEARFDSFLTEATAAFEKGEEWAADGAKTATAWIATRCRVSRAGTRRRVRIGSDLAPPARSRCGLAGGRHRRRSGPGHRLGPPAPQRSLHGP